MADETKISRCEWNDCGGCIACPEDCRECTGCQRDCECYTHAYSDDDPVSATRAVSE